MTHPTALQTIHEALAGVSLIDTHEHTTAEAVRLSLNLDFTYLFPDYLSSDLVSAGMPRDDLEAIRGPARAMNDAVGRQMDPRDAVYAYPERLPTVEPTLEAKWRLFAPYWERTRNTGYARCLLLAIRELFGIDDLNEDTYAVLSDALRASNRPGWYKHVLRERCGIERSICDCGTTDVDRELFAPAMRFDRFVWIRDRIDLGRLEYDTNTAIQSLDDLVDALEVDFARKCAEGMVTVKMGLAYQRTIHYEHATRHEAELAFDRLFRHPAQGVSFAEAKACQDYVAHRIIRLASEYGVPIQIHSGLLEGNGNVITNSQPTLLTELFLRYPRAHFDIFHAGYPYHHELACLAKNFANVCVDLCWMHMISPWMAGQILHEWLETVPVCKILGFGGDDHIVEGSFGHSLLARQVINRVLAEKVEAGYCSVVEAVSFGKQILRENARALFKLQVEAEGTWACDAAAASETKGGTGAQRLTGRQRE